MRKKYEVLSPAGDIDCLMSAVQFGADAVYLAGEQFGMRTASKNFNDENLAKGIEYAHNRGVKVYITCNILPRSKELAELPRFLSTAQDLGADAFIIADLGVMELAKKYAPNVECHVSTQAGIVNYETANVLYNMGASRVVLARELTIDEIAEIRAKIPSDLEIEVFVHGAMCVSFSGRCLISSYMTGRDANHGDCAQPCRWKYHLYEENREGQYFPVEENDKGTFLYNSRDLCMIEHIPELLQAGVTSLKIEGRAKSAYYTSVITNAYSNALRDYIRMGDSYTLAPWIKEEVNKVSHREYNTGFFFGSEPGQVTGNGGYIREYDVVAMCEGSTDDCTIITQRNKFFTGDTLDILPPGGMSFEVKVDEIKNEYGQTVESTPHAMEKLYIKTDKPIPQGSYLRKKRV
ncbi:MAG: U32 family peptidase [Lachnospiraceae bacterium]|nr:U32 family peptidase [Lachnospiraceae bacterium]